MREGEKGLALISCHLRSHIGVVADVGVLLIQSLRCSHRHSHILGLKRLLHWLEALIVILRDEFLSLLRGLGESAWLVVRDLLVACGVKLISVEGFAHSEHLLLLLRHLELGLGVDLLVPLRLEGRLEFLIFWGRNTLGLSSDLSWLRVSVVILELGNFHE